MCRQVMSEEGREGKRGKEGGREIRTGGGKEVGKGL